METIKDVLGEDELRVLNFLENKDWNCFQVDDENLPSERVNPNIYRFNCFIIDAGAQYGIMTTSLDLADRTESFRVCVSYDAAELERIKNFPKPHFIELMDNYKGLCFSKFLHVHNKIFIVRMNMRRQATLAEIPYNLVYDYGLLVTNSSGKMLLSIDETTPCQSWITTHEPTIEKVLSEASEVIPVSELV